MRKNIAVIFFLLILLAGCTLPFSKTPSEPSPIPISQILITANPNAGPTPTPFQPIPPTPTVGVYNTPSDNSKTVPVSSSGQNTDIANMNIEQPKGTVNILILGSDWRAGRGFRTDVIMLLSLNASKGTATLTSFPRDLYVSIPGVGMERINTAQEYGGFALTQATFQYNFGFTPDYYIMTNFNGFIGIIDTLGGINVSVSTPLYDQCSLPQQDGQGYCTINAGTNWMDGKTALWYVRSRHSTSDFDRTRRAQEVITGVFQKIMSLNAINRVPELYSMFSSSVETNIQASTILSLMPLATKIVSNPSMVQRFAIGPAQVSNYIVPGSGAMVLLPNQAAVMEIINQALNP